jgi:16S rRNA (uracil1498-N3)-methyltransferase
VGEGVLVEVSASAVVAEVGEVRRTPAGGVELTIASAVPKAGRADWMIEKLSELGVSRFVPLMTERSVVHPEGRNKIERWERLAAEAAKQSRRSGVMGVEGLVPVKAFVEGVREGRVGFLSTGVGVVSMARFLEMVESVEPSAEAEVSLAARGIPSAKADPTKITLLVGPEGGWSEGEVGWMWDRGLTAVTLGETILRVETAAIAAAAVVSALAGKGV